MSSPAGDEFFPHIGPIAFNPKAGPNDTLVFRHYNKDEVVLGRSMADWLRFAVCYWHTFRGKGVDIFGAGTIKRSWDDESNSMENAKRRLRAAFEFISKLGVQYWSAE
jgi:xylose isomerase